jgi:hypothetical protein
MDFRGGNPRNRDGHRHPHRQADQACGGIQYRWIVDDIALSRVRIEGDAKSSLDSRFRLSRLPLADTSCTAAYESPISDDLDRRHALPWIASHLPPLGAAGARAVCAFGRRNQLGAHPDLSFVPSRRRKRSQFLRGTEERLPPRHAHELQKADAHDVAGCVNHLRVEDASARAEELWVMLASYTSDSGRRRPRSRPRFCSE